MEPWRYRAKSGLITIVGLTMPYTPLVTVKHRIVLGQALPFNVLDATHALMLAKGQVVQTAHQLELLFQRGALVDLQELLTPAERIRNAPREALPGLWRFCMDDLHKALGHCADEHFPAALEQASQPVLALVERDPDLAIFQVMRQEANPLMQYGMDHALHTGITAALVARRLGWSSDEQERAMKVSLTMNVSMFELQGQLATQSTPITPEQRQAVLAHPEFSARMLLLAGVTDTDWIKAVLWHHEVQDGSGYPRGLRDTSDLANLVRQSDIYTTKLSRRANRQAMAPDEAARMVFMQDPKSSLINAIVKEFGLYPPGVFVRLMGGETGVVVQRGGSVKTPIVALLTDGRGQPLPSPLRCDTAEPGYGVSAILGEDPGMGRVSLAQLLAV